MPGKLLSKALSFSPSPLLLNYMCVCRKTGFTVTQGQLWNVGGRWKLGVRELLISLEIDILCLNQKWYHC